MEPYGDTKRIPFHLCVLGALMLLDKGSYQKNIGISALNGVSQPTVSRYFHQVVDLINFHVVPNEIRFPRTDDEFRRNVAGFQTRHQGLMPKVVGLIDGTLISIVSPGVFNPIYPARLFRTRKNFFGLNVIVITAYDNTFLYMNARYPGSCHDSGIFRTSLLRLQLVQEYLRTGRNRGILLGDQGFGVEPFLFPPIPSGNLIRDQEAYNQAHKIVRMGVQNIIGDMKMVFRCLLKDRTLHYDPTFCGKIVYACGALHNYRIRRHVRPYNEYEGEDSGTDSEVDLSDSDSDENDGGESGQGQVFGSGNNGIQRGRTQHPGDLLTSAGNQKRQQYIRNHFFRR